jgi:hypothetical protein
MKKSIYILLLLNIIICPCLYAQQITITTPNGGENWQNSNTFGIVWTDDIPEFVKIELYKGGTFHSTIINATPSNGYYIWIPNVAESGIDYKVKITSVVDASIFDFSDGDFTITKSEINITAPNGGENLQTSVEYGIVWSDNIFASVKIELFKGGVFYSTIVDTTPSNGYYIWSVDAAEAGNDYKVKITSIVSSNDFDFSDGDFTITKSEINITAPNGGENLQTSYPFGITYTDNILAPVKIELYKGGTFYSTIVDSAPSNGYYLWWVDAMEGGDDFKVKITSLASSNDFDFSDADFTITKSEITILIPNGGEVLIAGTENSIIYTDNIQGPFKIELYKGDVFYSTIVDTIPSNGFYLWAIPDTIPDGTDYKIKITSLNSVNDFDFSDNNFTIDNPNSINDILNQKPMEFVLMQNYPNPFNPATSIVFGLPVSSEIKIDLFSALGEKVDIIFSGYKEAGYHQIHYNASPLSTGIYFYRLQAASVEGQSYIETKKMIIIK